MEVIQTALPEVLLLKPRLFRDERGWFSETWNAETFSQHGIPRTFAQDNQSSSRRGVLRGLHYQLERPQGKLIRALRGRIFDVAVDIRRSSPNFGKWTGLELAGTDCSDEIASFWIPVGFAHGFVVLSETADVLYKATDFYHPKGERCIRWDDPTIGIAWPSEAEPLVSPKDACGHNLEQAAVFD